MHGKGRHAMLASLGLFKALEPASPHPDGRGIARGATAVRLLPPRGKRTMRKAGMPARIARVYAPFAKGARVFFRFLPLNA